MFIRKGHPVGSILVEGLPKDKPKAKKVSAPKPAAPQAQSVPAAPKDKLSQGDSVKSEGETK